MLNHFGEINMTQQFSWVENFISLEAEGPHIRPTVYTRLTGCNFECAGFNNPNNVPVTIDSLGFDPKRIPTLTEMPPIEIHCDSTYAHNPLFEHIWTKGSADDLIDEIEKLLPHKSWIHPVSKLPYMFSITGGEPTLFGKQIPELINHPRMQDCEVIIIETNCSVPLHKKLLEGIDLWLSGNSNRKWIWSNSPKMSNSGEAYSKAIKPLIAKQQLSLMYNCQVEQYFKFVCTDSIDDFNEVGKIVKDFRENGSIPLSSTIYIMPMACNKEQQDEIARNVAALCIEHGYYYSYRIQNALWSNLVGT